ncbi:MAG TPA: hypothetical protein ENI98_12135 [Gammaproteobacteria bacterium]|nr:hypothetical protein [Gammaproteobacteria bacterium]
MFIKDTKQWAKEIFGNADLGDNRRTERLVKLSAQMAAQSSRVSYQVKVKQKGGRKARTANVAIRYATISIRVPSHLPGRESLTLKVISCDEIGAPKGIEPLCPSDYCTLESLLMIRNRPKEPVAVHFLMRLNGPCYGSKRSQNPYPKNRPRCFGLTTR